MNFDKGDIDIGEYYRVHGMSHVGVDVGEGCVNTSWIIGRNLDQFNYLRFDSVQLNMYLELSASWRLYWVIEGKQSLRWI